MLDTRWLFLESDDEESKKDKGLDNDKKTKDVDKEEYNDLLDSTDDDEDDLPYMDDSDNYDDDNEDSDGEYNTLIVSSTIDNDTSNDLFSKLANAGYACTVVASNMRHIHYLIAGKKFDEIHKLADNLYSYFNSMSDSLFELAMQSELTKLDNPANSAKHCEDITLLSNSKYDYNDAISLMRQNISSVIRYIENARSAADSRTDIQSELDNWLLYLNKKNKYFLARRTECECTGSMKESYNFLL